MSFTPLIQCVYPGSGMWSRSLSLEQFLVSNKQNFTKIRLRRLTLSAYTLTNAHGRYWSHNLLAERGKTERPERERPPRDVHWTRAQRVRSTAMNRSDRDEFNQTYNSVAPRRVQRTNERTNEWMSVVFYFISTAGFSLHSASFDSLGCIPFITARRYA